MEFVNRVRAGAPVEEDRDPLAAGTAEEALHWAAAAAAAELHLAAAAAAAAEMEEEAAQNQAVLGGIRTAAEGPELTEVYPGTEDKVAGQPGNVEVGGMKTGPGTAGSKKAHPETEEDLMEVGSTDAGSLGHWNAAEGTNPAEGLHGEQEGSADRSSLLGSGHKLLGLAVHNPSIVTERREGTVQHRPDNRTKQLMQNSEIKSCLKCLGKNSFSNYFTPSFELLKTKKARQDSDFT